MTLHTFNPSFPIQKVELLEEVPLFEKRTVVELSDSELAEAQGGTTPVCVAAAASSGYCAGAAVAATVFVATAVVGYFANKK